MSVNLVGQIPLIYDRFLISVLYWLDIIQGHMM